VRDNAESPALADFLLKWCIRHDFSELEIERPLFSLKAAFCSKGDRITLF
jgi:hypothetical protein